MIARFFTTPRGYVVGMVVMLALAGASLWVHAASAHVDTISPRAHADINDGGEVNVIDQQQTAACIQQNPCADPSTHDHSYDGTVNIIDLLISSQCTGTVSNLPCSQGYGYRDLIFDSVGAHDANPCVPSSYSWYDVAEIQAEGPHSGANTMTAWGGWQWACGDHEAGVSVELANFRAWAWDGSAPWLQLVDAVGWCAKMDAEHNNFSGDCDGGNGPTWTMPNSDNSFHFANGDRPALPTGTQCLATVGDARQIAGTGGIVMLNLGSDWWDGFNYISGAVVGRLHMLTGNWQRIGGSSCDPDVIRQHPPPF